MSSQPSTSISGKTSCVSRPQPKTRVSVQTFHGLREVSLEPTFSILHVLPIGTFWPSMDDQLVSFRYDALLAGDLDVVHP